MTLNLSQLLDDPGLGLRSIGSALSTLTTPIEWVAVTEVANPRPFLSGGELVLTTGARLSTADAQRSFVRQIKRAGAVGLGFGIGLGHESVPAALIVEANRWSIPIFEVPYRTPFLAIGKLVTDSRNADHLAEMQRLLNSHQALAQSLLATGGEGGGLAQLLSALRKMIGTEVVLEQFRKRLYPSLAELPEQPGGTPDDEAWLPIPVPTGQRDACTLWLRRPVLAADLSIVDYAKNLISVELANQWRRRQDARAASGQVIEDLLRGTLPAADIAARLHGIGVDQNAKHIVLLLSLQERRAGLLSGIALPTEFDTAITALLGQEFLVIAPASAGDPVRLAKTLSAYLRDAGISGPVGIGGAYAQPSGLRWSYFEARDAAGRGLEVNEPERLSLTSLLLASEDVPMTDMAAETLKPLRDFDAAHGAELLTTLEAYLQLNGSLAAVAAELSLHRNTVRYRLGQITELTGYDPALTADRVQLWLALSVRKLR
ncbi:PucR family transcriptional regulator ligand-binding domain-containing protein [Acaricomes phytoseiuli]|uniref:PucR family transcriptional regulator n=1 Tax=Acaricomes phytoseiuli TaxID=291968 RepID=UPI0022229717|nr:PucR family transcriptional regulator [Acaricomes phytoseiuli]MCW1248930.1 PucR family transcriptional regulator ligand-binding domain-containing protein [Acaricomes phytoseiuli]